MKFCVIGIGKFGYEVATALTNNGVDVLAIDQDDAKVEHIRDRVSHAACIKIITKQILLTILLLFTTNQCLASSEREKIEIHSLIGKITSGIELTQKPSQAFLNSALKATLVNGHYSVSLDNLRIVKKLISLGASTKITIYDMSLVSYLTYKIKCDTLFFEQYGPRTYNPAPTIAIIEAIQELADQEKKEERWQLKKDWIKATFK